MKVKSKLEQIRAGAFQRLSNCATLAEMARQEFAASRIYQNAPRKHQLLIDIVLKRIVELSPPNGELTVRAAAKRLDNLSYLVRLLQENTSRYPHRWIGHEHISHMRSLADQK